MKKVTIIAHAQPYAAIVEIPKAEMEPIMEAHFQKIEKTLPFISKKGFRTQHPTREMAEESVGVVQLYHLAWREVFITSINKRAESKSFVCFADDLNVTDRGAHYEVSGMFYFAPTVGFDSAMLKSLESGKENWIHDLIVNEHSIGSYLQDMRTKVVMDQPSTDYPVTKGSYIEVEVDSDVNKGFKGQPQKAIWKVEENSLPKEIIDLLLGKQVGHFVILPLKSAPANARMTVRIVKHILPSSVSDDQIAKTLGYKDGKALLTLATETIEKVYREQKASLFFYHLSRRLRLNPIPGPLVDALAISKIEAQKAVLGPKEFKHRYGKEDRAIFEHFLKACRDDAVEMFLAYGLCEHFGMVPSTDDVNHVMECDKIDDNVDAKIYVFLLLCRETVLKNFCGIEPPLRSKLELASKLPTIIK